LVSLDAVIEAIEGYSYLAAERELVRLSWLMTSRHMVRGVAMPLMRPTGQRLRDQRLRDQRLRVSRKHMLTQLLGNLLSSMTCIYRVAKAPGSLRPLRGRRLLHVFQEFWCGRRRLWGTRRSRVGRQPE
jgi:hypothetical protein